MNEQIGDFEIKPDGIKRLGEEIFVPHKARRLDANEFEVVYLDSKFPKELANKLAIVLIDDKCSADLNSLTAYADRQKDKTDIGLSGNQGSGRAVYYGKQYNIIGVGKTSLCTSAEAKHSTGKMELVGSLRRVIVSRWINYFTKRAGTHVAALALKESGQFKWAKNPIPLALLVRIDDGYLDRPSHVEYSPTIEIDFDRVLMEYAKIDAEFFAYRYMLGAWSNGNYSLDGRIIDLETISFTKYRGPYKTAGSKRIENFFGYEGRGFILILKQLAEVKGVPVETIEDRFYEVRKKHRAHCFLILLGVTEDQAERFLEMHGFEVQELSGAFESLSKKISPRRVDMSLYVGVSEANDPSLLNMSLLFRNLAKLIGESNREQAAYDFLVRKVALQNIASGVEYIPALTKVGSINAGEICVRDVAVVTYEQKPEFVSNVKKFVHDLFVIIDLLKDEELLPEAREWSCRLEVVNQDLPTFDELNEKLFTLVEKYRIGEVTASGVGVEVENLCMIPWYN